MRSKRDNREFNGDIISSLPDSVLSEILSRLPTNEAAATNILSKRWYNLWTQITRLNFSSNNFNSTPPFASICAATSNAVRRLTTTEINVFRFAVENPPETNPPSDCMSWVNDVCRLKPKTLTLIVEPGACRPDPQFRRTIPSSIFTCESLVELFVDCPEFNYEMPNEFLLSNLKVLKISINDHDLRLTDELFRSCPTLEVLDIKTIPLRIYDEGKRHKVYVSSDNLNDLRIDLDDWNVNCKIFIDAANLKVLVIKDTVFCRYLFVKNLDSLRYASLEIGSCCFDLRTTITTKSRAQVSQLLTRISNVYTLVIQPASNTTLTFLDDDDIPLFMNLTVLKVVMHFNIGWRFLSRILKKAPHLQTMNIEKCVIMHGYITEGLNSQWSNPDVGPGNCFLSHLKTVELEGFNGEDTEMMMIDYLAYHGKSLNKFILKVSCLDKNKEVAQEKEMALCESLFERTWASQTCDIRFVGKFINESRSSANPEASDSATGSSVLCKRKFR